MSVSPHKISLFIKERRFWAESLQEIKQHSERFLVINLVGTTIVTIAISSFSTIMAISFSHYGILPEKQMVPFIVSVASVVILLVGEIAPKILWVRFTDVVALKVAPIYRTLLFVFRPINFLIEFFIRFINLFTGKKTELHSHTISSEELEAFIDLSRDKWAVEDHEHRKIKGILELSETEAASVMTPRVNIESISANMTVWEAIEVFLTSTHSRLPVYTTTIDAIESVVTLREMFLFKKEGKEREKLKDLPLEKIIKVPLTKPIDALFEIFQRSRKHIALVIDEYGGVAGLVTMEDIIEEVFGDIQDEKDQEKECIRKYSDGSLYVQWRVLINEILEIFHIHTLWEIGLPDSLDGESVSYMIITLLERFPNPKETITLGNGKIFLSLQVIHVTDGKIEDIIIRKIVH